MKKLVIVLLLLISSCTDDGKMSGRIEQTITCGNRLNVVINTFTNTFYLTVKDINVGLKAKRYYETKEIVTFSYAPNYDIHPCESEYILTEVNSQ